MRTDRTGAAGRATRRAVLGGIVWVAAAGATGCVQRVRSLVNRRTRRQMSLSIKTVPADADRAATTIARRLATNLEAAGIDTEMVLLTENELLRDVLLNHEFDLYVARHEGSHDPDFLRPLLHSVFTGEPGWQNPFGFTNLAVDELLDEQRRIDGPERRLVVSDVQRRVARQQPFAVVAVPDEIRAARTDRFEAWSEVDPTSPLSYLALRRRGAGGADEPDADDDGTPADGEPSRLQVTITDAGVTMNFNPIAVEFRNRGTFTGLLYDPLAHVYDGAIRPWLLDAWTWEAAADGTVASLRLREDLSWHDGQALTATDAAFTFRFLADTSLGDGERRVPSPRFRGRTSMVDAVEVLDDRRLRVAFGDTSPEVAARAFTVPVLPEHEWLPRTSEADLVGVDLFDGVTEALVWANPEPVGSGPLAFEDSVQEESLRLSRFDDHFFNAGEDEALADRFGSGVAFDELVVRVVPSDEVAVELLVAEEADVTAPSIEPTVVPRVGRHEALQLLVGRSTSFYHVGFNARRDPLGNPHFRRAVARLLDKSFLVDDVFDGYAAPAATPLAGTGWEPSDLRWEGADPEVPFAGSGGDLDRHDARDAFRQAGYQYDDDGRLLEG